MTGKRQWSNINDFCKLLPNLHSKIKFIMEHSFRNLPFLDILIKNQNGQIIVNIYHKITDTEQYLQFNSHRPKNWIEYIPYTYHVEYVPSSLTKTSDKAAWKNNT